MPYERLHKQGNTLITDQLCPYQHFSLCKCSASVYAYNVVCLEELPLLKYTGSLKNKNKKIRKIF